MKKRAWMTKTDGFDGAGLVVAKTPAGARGFSLRAARAAGYEMKRENFECEVVCLYHLDGWAAKAKAGKTPSLEHALQEIEYERRDAFKAVVASMRKDGNGLTHTQEHAIADAIGAELT